MDAPGAGLEILTVSEMYRADAATIAGGVPGTTLMENAGAAVAAAVRRRWSPRPTLVLAGPGANGGDGWVAARLLAAAGWPVRVGLLGDRAKLTGDAAHHAALWAGPTAPAAPDAVADADLIVDALFGAGLARALDGQAKALADAMAASPAPVVAVDLPSGVNGDSGQVLGAAASAALTVTFFRKKPGHLLAPGRFLAGEIVVADIGVGPAADPATLFENAPALWPGTPAAPDPMGHKYGRGHVLVAGGAETTGAARMAARAALRAGAGLATIACPRASWPVYAAAELAVMVRPVDDAAGFAALLDDPRFSTAVLGPGLGVDAHARALVRAAAAAGRRLVLDADALTAFERDPPALFAMTEAAPAAVLTPHGGEFRRLFPDIAAEPTAGKVAQARAAARRAGAVVLLKGPDTVIAAPDGRATINGNAPPTLATAGAGDVLAGVVAGLLADGAGAFAAAAAAAWLHGAAASAHGPGLIASDLIDRLPAAVEALA